MRENGQLVELNTFLDPLSCIIGHGTSKYSIIPSMAFGCSDHMLELGPFLSQTPLRDLCILHRLPKILEASDLRPVSRRHMVSPPQLSLHIR